MSVPTRAPSITVLAFLAGFAALAGATRPSDACPGVPCGKYRQIEAPVAVYRRAVRATPPKRVAPDFLVGATWVPVSTGSGPRARDVRFVSPTIPAQLSAERVVLVRRLEVRNRTDYVEIDGVFYALGTCLDDARRATSCLTRVGDLPAEAKPAETKQRFATPP